MRSDIRDQSSDIRGNMQAVILAGGEGTRLRPLTLDRPKPTVPLLNIPFLHYQLALFSRHRIQDVILSVSHRPDAIRAVMGEGTVGDVRLRYRMEESPLGTGGGVRNSADLLSGRLVVCNGDILTDLDLTAVCRFHEENRAKATIVLTRVLDPTQYGLIELEPSGRVRRFREKPSAEEITTDTINAGTYVLERELLDEIPEGVPYSIERQFFPALLERGIPVFGYVSPSYWLDIGTPAKYLQAHRDLLSGSMDSPLPIPGKRLAEGIWAAEGATLNARCHYRPPLLIGPEVEIEPGATLGPFAVLGARARIGRAAVVESSVLWEESVVGQESALASSLLGRGCRIGAHVVVQDAVLGQGAVVPDYSILGSRS
ncbi:MAG TPA: NDP-sugar synthase [Methylomirabilota bacterium]|nr:NDP-sugar synthase [Methylomirabilota bacterium]